MAMAKVTNFQTIHDVLPDYADHIFVERTDGTWKCCTCGAVTKSPPCFPTHKNWMPERYENITDSERLLAKRKTK